MDKTITKIMCKEHDRIDKLLKIFEKELNNPDNAKRIFYKLKWDLDKHFFIEEKIVFSVYEEHTQEDNMDLLRLLKEHKDIYWIISKIEDSFDSRIKPEISELKNLLKNHAKFEDNSFYPKLDSDLNDSQKAVIFDRADEIIK